MTREELEKCWRDPANYKWGCYYSKADPRVIVPKRLKWMGWTVNFAHFRAIPVLLLLLAILLAPILLVRFLGGGQGFVFAAACFGVTAMCLLCAYLSSRTE
jgi:hypothetical protein